MSWKGWPVRWRSRWEELGGVDDCASYVAYIFGCQVWFPMLFQVLNHLTEAKLT
jgi:hypothetical protein